MKLQILLELPPAPEKTEKSPKPMSVEDKVRDALELIESGYDSNVEWLMINKLYKALCQGPQSPRKQSLKKMIEPVLSKYGYHGTAGK